MNSSEEREGFRGRFAARCCVLFLGVMAFCGCTRDEGNASVPVEVTQKSFVLGEVPFGGGRYMVRIEAQEENLTSGSYHGQAVAVLENRDGSEVKRYPVVLSGSLVPVFASVDYFAMVCSKEPVNVRSVLVVDTATRSFRIYDTDQKYIANVAVYGDYLYYSTEDPSAAVVRVRLDDASITEYRVEIRTLLGSDFTLIDGDVYVYEPVGRRCFAVAEGLAEKPCPQGFAPHTYRQESLSDFPPR